MTQPDDAALSETKPFLEHLEDMRSTVIRCFIALGICIIIALPLTRQILLVLKHPLSYVVDDPDQFLRSLRVVGAFSLMMRVAFWSGLLAALPFLLFYIGRFIFPGLTRLERSVALKASFFAVLLFMVGVCLGYFISLRVALKVMLQLHAWLGIRAEWVVTDYVVFVIQLLIAFGLAFEMPVIMFALGKMGIIHSDQLIGRRRHAIVFLLVLAMILTPPDICTQLLMAVPLFLLYEICIWLLRASEKRNGVTGANVEKQN